MGLINDVFEDSLPGVVVGAVATAILMPLVGGTTAGAAGAAGHNGQGQRRQLLKAAVRGYVNITDRLKEATAEAREQLSDLAAEVREERRIQAESAEAGDGADAATEAPTTRHRKRSQGAKRR